MYNLSIYWIVNFKYQAILFIADTHIFLKYLVIVLHYPCILALLQLPWAALLGS